MDAIFYWIGGATFILSIGNLTIAVDPVLCKKGTIQDYFWFKSQRIEEPVYNIKDFENIDLWLITHNHEDHLDSVGLSVINDNAKIVTNKNASKILLKNGKRNLSILKWRQTKLFKIKNYTIEIEAIPAIHGVNPLSALFAGKGNGYFIKITKGNESIQIYITGDTVYKNKLIKALKNKTIDLMVPNMGAAGQGTWVMTLTLNSKMLKKMMDKLQPKMVIPVHFGTFEHYYEPVDSINRIGDNRIKIIKVGEKLKLEKNLFKNTTK